MITLKDRDIDVIAIEVACPKCGGTCLPIRESQCWSSGQEYIVVTHSSGDDYVYCPTCDRDLRLPKKYR